MKLFNRDKSSNQNGLNPRMPRVRDPQRRLPQAGQNRTFSYYAARSQAEIPIGREAVQNKPPIRRLPTRLQRLRKHAGLVMLGLVAVAIIGYELQLSTMPKVVSLAQSSDAPFLQDSAVYQRAARALFNASAANRNKLTVDSSRIAAELRAQFPELQAISVALPVIGATPTVYVRPAQPALVLAAANGTFVVDENGRALAEATANTNLDGLNIPTITDQTNLTVKLGQQVLPRNATAFIGTVVAQLKAKHITVQAMTLPAAAGELDVYLGGQTYFVKYNLQQGQGGTEAAKLQTGTYLAVRNRLEQKGTRPGQYVDVRLEGRAYYR